ncbi:methyl-accepting chemotaxis protein [Aetokthonos hydrillicola Thurmond2011]|jgi:methyl-accepting chemotaxis protein|uniref:Methyl-accepting chemotaxis protein n=1 Tax=Aetokthonos hydrillicola Thurmond2011 TaxID=2712845 RepID=A0AAP5IAV8_9CYAN|nr:methyl-accepting chemotaxis protein [Aetokthonos hydrillicola]MBO3461605.1 chemotaxis protein [Aetokthonos hydrillicola CCALA 1050]MBW4589304.1 CHASE3 domain-containing protein [Aetokthonos hydrillicola CCALA 1050]MDR9898162.1 methyl-accepting chemotaxis protein [Aetokthonos hydrillicola Thurmond2011]
MPERKNVKHPLKVDQIVPIGFGIVLILIGIVITISQISKAKLIKMQLANAQKFEVKELLAQIENDLIDGETEQRGYLITRDENYLERYEARRNTFKRHAESLKQLVNSEQSQVTTTNEIVNIAQKKFAELDEAIALKKLGKDQEVLAVLQSKKGQQITDSLKAKLVQMNQQHQQILAQTKQASDQFQQFSTILDWGGWVVSVAAGISISFYVVRWIMQPINEAANAVSTSSTNIAATILQQERTIVQQSASVNQTTATVEQVGAFATESAKQAETSAEGVQQALTLTEKGVSTVALTVDGISELRNQVMAIAGQAAHLSQQTSQISKVSLLVAKFATQTNILALNAEVEAVKAGEEATGFGMIAKEIRNLADQSNESAAQISLLVDQVQGAIDSTVLVTQEGTRKADDGIKLAQETGDAFTNIADAVKNIFFNNEKIVLTAKQQAAAVQQIISAMNNINLGAKETAVAITQIKNATVELNETVQNLQDLI